MSNCIYSCSINSDCIAYSYNNNTQMCILYYANNNASSITNFSTTPASNTVCITKQCIINKFYDESQQYYLFSSNN